MKESSKIIIHKSNTFLIKNFFLWLMVAFFGFFSVYAFMIRTDIDQAIQYIRETIYTTSGGGDGDILIHLWTWNNTNPKLNANVWTTWKLWAMEYCDRNFQNCRKIEQTVTGVNLTDWYITLSNNWSSTNPWYSITNSIMQQYWNSRVWVGVTNLDSSSYNWYNFVVNGASNTNDMFVNNKTYSPQYCTNSSSPQCFAITDFYTKLQIDTNHYTKTQSDIEYYNKTYTNNNYYTTWQINTATWLIYNKFNDYYTKTQSDIEYYNKTYINNNYYTTWQINTATWLIYTSINSISWRLENLSWNITNNYRTSGQISWFVNTNYYNKTYIDSKLANNITWAGTTNYIPKFNSNNTIGDSIIYNNGANIWIDTNITPSKLSINGTINITKQASMSSPCNEWTIALTWDATNSNLRWCVLVGWVTTWKQLNN